LIDFAKDCYNLINLGIKKYGKILLKWLKYIVLFLLLIIILLSTSFVQTKLAKYATNSINEEFGTDLLIKKVDLSFLGSVQLKGVEIRDHHKDTLIFVNKLSTSLLNAKKILDGEVKLKSISLEDVYFNMKTYKDENDDSLSIFIDSFDNDEPKDSIQKPFILETSNIYVNNLNYKLIDENDKNPITYQVLKTGGNLQDFSIIGPDVKAKIRGLYFTESNGLNVTNLTTDFLYSLTAMNFKNTILETRSSKIDGDIVFTYKREDLKDFNDKVKIKANFRKSSFSIKDFKNLYTELDGNDVLSFTGNIKGTLNNLTAQNLNLNSKNGLKIYGNLSFVNLINSERGFVFDGDLRKVSAKYSDLKSILPNVLGNTLPSEFSRFGRFTLKGLVRVTPEQVAATLNVNSEIGTIISDLQIANIGDIDYATYNGDVELRSFDIGVLFNDPLFNKISLKGDVDGSGFKLENINTSFIGEVTELDFKNYKYTNIKANGQYQNNKFDGDLFIDDTNFKMNFKGLADLSSDVHKFDFDANITSLNLKETNLFTRDSTAILKGKIILDVEGNTFDDIVGKATFNDIYYTNQKEEFTFKEFNISSSVKDSIKRIEVSSKDIANGYLSGKFSFSELLPVAQNALGSIYTNYKPYEVGENQFLDFNFTIYNQIVNVFFPEVYIDDKTKVKGKVVSDRNLLKLNITSPRIEVYGNEIKDIKLLTDNKNPLYNTSLTASKLNTKYYNLSKLNLLNRTENDTLYFKSIFEGGKLNNEEFNLDFYYTINPEGKSVIAFQESSFNFKENVWKINPDKKNTDKIIFDLKTNEFDFSQFKIVSNEQKIEFTGSLKGDNEKKLLADFTKVKLESFLPEIDSLALKGIFSGNLDFVQKDGVYSPEAIVLIKDFEINNFKQGDLALNIVGDNSYEKYNVDLSLNREKVKSIAANGVLDFSTKRPLIDLKVFLEDFSLNAFSPLGQDVLSSIRGTASGDINLRGFLGNPEMQGTLRLKDAGMMFPYLNVDYDFEGESIITLDEQAFNFESVNLLDTKHGTRGVLKGAITHQNFNQWFLNIEIKTDNLLVLDTKNTEEALYYGSGFLKGTASITGLTDQLTIDVNGSTQPGTVFVVPLKDIETVNSYKLIHFKSDTIKVADRQKELVKNALKGLSLNINLDVTKDAKMQVVIDEVYGSQLTGFGSGALDIQINTRGKFNIFGDYTIDSGVYDFKYGGIVNKPFVIQKGGTVSWNGDPYEANLNVTAVYKARANPSTLLDNFNSSRNIEVDLVTKITGGLFSSKQELDIELPNVDPSIATELEFILNDNNVNEKTTQFISLLTLGSFVNPDKINFDSTSAITSTASNAITAAFSSLINSPDSKFKFGVDYIQGVDNSDTDRLNVDNQVDVSVSTNVSDRIIVNGTVGVPVGAKTQSSVIGEVKVEVLLNKEGNFRGVIFNRQNEIQYSTEEEGYTQGVGLSYQVNFNTFSEFLKKIGLKKNIKKKLKTVKKDSLLSKNKKLINFEGN
jgi:hypothetical protein